MKVRKNILNKLEKMTANLAYKMSERSANSTCAFLCHQSKLPNKVKHLITEISLKCNSQIKAIVRSK